MATDYLTALGAGAGLDTKAIVDSLVEAQRAPQQAAIDRNMQKTETRISAYGVVKSSVSALKTAFDQLKDVSDLKSFSLTTSANAGFTASGSSAASAANHEITIHNLAERDIWASNNFAAATTSLNSGASFSVDITTGGSTTSVTVDTATPQGVVDAINSAGLGLEANLVNTGADSDPYTITVRGAEGADNAFTVASGSMDLSFGTQLSTAEDASLTVNGITVARESNSINDVIDGVTLSLQSETTTGQSLSVTTDTDAAKAAIENLVSVYNDVFAVFKSLRNNEGSTDDELVGSLSSDSPFRGILNQVRGMVTGLSSTPSGDVDSFSALGVSITREGSLEIDSARLDERLSNNFDDVVTALTGDQEAQSEFSQTNAGLAGDASKELAAMLRSTGIISRVEVSGNDQISEYETRLEDLDARMALLMDRYTKQFSAMQSIVDQMNNTRDYLEQQLSNLPFSQSD